MIVSIDTIMSVDRNYSCLDRISLHTALEGAEAASILHQSTLILNSAKSSYWLKAFTALNKKFKALQLKFNCSSSTMAMQRDMPFGRRGFTRHEPMQYDLPSPPRQSSFEPREHHDVPSPPRQSSYKPREKERRSKLKKRRRTRKSDAGASHSTAPVEEPLDRQPEQRVEHPTNPSPSQPAPWRYTKESMNDFISAYFTWPLR